ncbi:DUF2397 domain-containing protein [Anoxybacter fermentans]|nr:DUF2397 domain-containing protein [Anoxybacter fermentans]
MKRHLTEKVVETTYLTAQNVAQYRFILRFFMKSITN